MNIPEIGDTIDNDQAIALCCHFGLEEVAERIEAAPDDFKPWVFYGASMVPDKLASKLLKIPNLTLLALQHNLPYAYGVPGDEKAKFLTDCKLAMGIVLDGGSVKAAWGTLVAVHIFGDFKTNFGWGSARV